MTRTDDHRESWTSPLELSKTFFENLGYSVVAVNNCQPPLLFQFVHFFDSHGHTRHRLHREKDPFSNFRFPAWSSLFYTVQSNFIPRQDPLLFEYSFCITFSKFYYLYNLLIN